MVRTVENFRTFTKLQRGAIFNLITTDVLGPFSTGYAFSQMGLGPGIALFTVFGALAAYFGFELWSLFVQLNSTWFPVRGYGDLAGRIYGTWFVRLINVLQSFQLFLNVALIILVTGQSISQLSNKHLCFLVCLTVCTVSGALIGQIRTLQRFGWLSTFPVFLNFLIIFIT